MFIHYLHCTYTVCTQMIQHAFAFQKQLLKSTKENVKASNSLKIKQLLNYYNDIKT